MGGLHNEAVQALVKKHTWLINKARKVLEMIDKEVCKNLALQKVKLRELHQLHANDKEKLMKEVNALDEEHHKGEEHIKKLKEEFRQLYDKIRAAHPNSTYNADSDRDKLQLLQLKLKFLQKEQFFDDSEVDIYIVDDREDILTRMQKHIESDFFKETYGDHFKIHFIHCDHQRDFHLFDIEYTKNLIEEFMLAGRKARKIARRKEKMQRKLEEAKNKDNDSTTP